MPAEMSRASTHGTGSAFSALKPGTTSSRVGFSTPGANSAYIAEFWIIGVSTSVGHTAFTVMPYGPSSRAADVTRPIRPHSAARVAPYDGNLTDMVAQVETWATTRQAVRRPVDDLPGAGMPS